ncbi:MFS transporter [Microlunatus sp. GCM10028923]|uniref:MFS transporter n=1 Tax=Microlunatus sp. GCM10028923 TaxID=3273400 RepID=UPI003614D837
MRRQDPGPVKAERLIMVSACAGAFLVVLDATMVSVALPRIGASLGFTAESLPWVVNAYTLAFAAFLLPGGRLSDRIGLRRGYLVGLGLFTLARGAAGLAWSPTSLLAARAVQGLGAALLMPATLALLTTLIGDPARRARMLAGWSAVGAVGASLGPVIGGPLTQWLDWPAVFLITVPVGLAAMIVAARALPTAQPVPTGPGRSAGWSILRLRQVSSGNLIMLLLGLGFLASPVLLSLYLQQVLGFTVLEAGLGFLPIGAAMFAGARLAGPLTVRLGPRSATVISCLVGAVGFGLAAVMITGRFPYLISVVLPGVLLGLGSAAAFTPITVAATSGVPAGSGGLAAGLLNTVRQASGAIGLAVLARLSVAAGSEGPAFAVSGICLAAAAVLAALIMPRS